MIGVVALTSELFRVFGSGNRTHDTQRVETISSNQLSEYSLQMLEYFGAILKPATMDSELRRTDIPFGISYISLNIYQRTVIDWRHNKDAGTTTQQIYALKIIFDKKHNKLNIK